MYTEMIIVCVYTYTLEYNQTGWPNKFREIGESKPRSFEPWSILTSDFKIDTCHFLAWRSALLGYSKDCLAQGQDNVTECALSQPILI